MTIPTIGPKDFAGTGLSEAHIKSWWTWASALTTSVNALLALGGGISGSGVLTVAGDGSQQYTTIAAALAAALSGQTVLLYPGTYAESFTVPNGVRVVGFPNAQSVILAGADATSTRVTFAGTGTLRDVTILGPSSGANPAVDASGLGAPQLAVLLTVNLVGAGGTGPLFVGSGAGTSALLGVYHNGGVTGQFIEASGGNIIFNNVIGNAGTAETFFLVSGGQVEGQSITCAPSYTATNGLYVTTAGSSVQIDGLLFPQFTNTVTNALRVGADNVDISLTSAHLHGLTYDFLVDSGLVGTDVSINISGECRVEQTSFPIAWFDTARAELLFNDDGVKNDSSFRIISELSVGLLEAPHEAVFGTGDSIVPSSVLLYDDSGALYTDVTTEAQLDSGLTFTMLGDVGDRMLVGYRLPFVNVKATISTAAILGAGEIIAKIWTGASYETIRTMSSLSNNPHRQRGNALFEETGGSHVRFDIEGDADPLSGTFAEPFVNWTAHDPGSIGESLYYVVFEVVTANLSTPAEIERLKIGGSRIELNEDGFPEQFGLGEGVRKSVLGGERRNFAGGGAPGSATFTLSPNVVVTVANATFANNGTDGFVKDYLVTRGIDTSRMFAFYVDWTVAGVLTGDVELELIVSLIGPDDNIDAGTLTEQSFSKVTTITAANDDGVKNTTVFYFALPEAVPGDTISVALYRNAGAGNPDDTLAGSIKIYKTDLRAVNWTGN